MWRPSGATLGSTPLTGWYAPNEAQGGAQSVVTFDLSDAAFSGLTQAKIGLIDYADNQTVSDYDSLTGGTESEVQPTSVELNKTQAALVEGSETTLNPLSYFRSMRPTARLRGAARHRRLPR